MSDAQRVKAWRLQMHPPVKRRGRRYSATWLISLADGMVLNRRSNISASRREVAYHRDNH
jgi:hypothetical protein